MDFKNITLADLLKNEISEKEQDSNQSSKILGKLKQFIAETELIYEKNKILQQQYGPYIKIIHDDPFRTSYVCNLCLTELPFIAVLQNHCSGKRHLEKMKEIVNTVNRRPNEIQMITLSAKDRIVVNKPIWFDEVVRSTGRGRVCFDDNAREKIAETFSQYIDEETVPKISVIKEKITTFQDFESLKYASQEEKVKKIKGCLVDLIQKKKKIFGN